MAPRDSALALDDARVLVVENDFIILMELESLLIEAGAEIVGLCQTVKDALVLAEQDGLSAAVLDIHLASENIVPVAARLANRGIPFILYTGQLTAGSEIDRIREHWPGCKIVQKPAHRTTLVTAIADLLGRSG
jgi:DNA-binding NtrC family response regulator